MNKPTLHPAERKRIAETIQLLPDREIALMIRNLREGSDLDAILRNEAAGRSIGTEGEWIGPGKSRKLWGLS